jgi:hypothetical protein
VGIPESTLKTIRKQAEFKESWITQIEMMIMLKLERMLAQ